MKFFLNLIIFLRKKYNEKTIRQRRNFWINSALYSSMLLVNLVVVIAFNANWQLMFAYAIFVLVIGILNDGDFFFNVKRIVFRDRFKAGEVIYLKSINHDFADLQLFSVELKTRKEAFLNWLDYFGKRFSVLKESDLNKVFLVVEDEYPGAGLASLFSSKFNPIPYDGPCPRIKILHEKGVFWANPKIFKRTKAEKI